LTEKGNFAILETVTTQFCFVTMDWANCPVTLIEGIFMNEYCKHKGLVIDASNPKIFLEFDSDQSDGEDRGTYLVREIKKLQSIAKSGQIPTRHDYDRYHPFVVADTKEFEIVVYTKNKVVYK